MLLQNTPPRHNLQIRWEKLPDDFVLPDDPVETLLQPYLAAALTDALGEDGLIAPEMLIAGNFGLVATVNQKVIVKAPDWLWVSRVNPVAPGAICSSGAPRKLHRRLNGQNRRLNGQNRRLNELSKNARSD